MTTLTATDARREFFDVVKGATDKHQVYRIHHRRGSVVLMAEDDYESLLETMELLSTPGFRKRLKRSVEQMHKGVFWKEGVSERSIDASGRDAGAGLMARALAREQEILRDHHAAPLPSAVDKALDEILKESSKELAAR